MNRLKLGIILVVVFFSGIGVGSIVSGGRSSTKSVSNGDKEIEKSTTRENSADEVVEEVTAESMQLEKNMGRVEVKSQTKRVMGIGTTDVVGEVVNNTQNDVMSIKVTATFYDAEGKVVATNATYAGETTEVPLPAGATAPFDVSSYPNRINADSVKLDVTWR